MKVAILLFGHLRNFRECAPSLRKYIIDPYKADVFIHTWDQTDHNTLTRTSTGSSRTDMVPVDDQIRKEISKYYSPKAISVEHQLPYEKATIIEVDGSKFSTAGPHFQFYTLRKANELRKQYEKDNNIKYDCVLVTRPDVMFLSDLDILRVFEQAAKINLNVERCRFFALSKQPAASNLALNINGTNDLIFFGKPEVIDKYIEANRDIEVEYFKKHLINVVSVYTAKEIENGIMPIPMAYILGVDWYFSGRKENVREYKSSSIIKSFIAKSLVVITKPVFKFASTHSWINPEY